MRPLSQEGTLAQEQKSMQIFFDLLWGYNKLNNN